MTLKTGSLVAGIMMLSLATAAAGQEGEICPEVGAGAVWIGGDEAGSDAATATGPLDQNALAVPPGGNTLLAFTLSAASDMRLEANPGFGGDTVIELYTIDGAQVAVDDDSGGNLASRIETTLEPGSYCLLTRSFGGGPLVADVRIARQEFEAITEGFAGFGEGYFGAEPCLPDTPATRLGQGPIDAQIADAGSLAMTNTADAVPYYRFTLGSPQAISITAENEWADPYIYVYDGAGNLIGENDDYNGYDSQIDFASPLAAGEYCIAVEALSSPTEPITLSVLGYDPQRAMYNLFANGDAPPTPGSGYPITELGALNTRLIYDQPVGDDAVWYSFTVPEGGLVLINAVEISDSDPMITLFDGAGRYIDFNDDAGNGLDSQLAVPVGPGAYMLGVMQYSSGYAGVIRVSLERYIPAR